MKRDFLIALCAAVLMMGALILGRSLQEILIVLLGIVFVWLKRSGGKTS